MFGLRIFLLLGGEFETSALAAVRGNLLVAFIVGILLLAVLVGLVCVYAFRGRNEKTGKSQKCAFCGGSIYSSGIPHAIKNRVVCGQCYKKIEEEKAKIT
jgi:hypothetical protein